jgi:hypothetical protein
MKTRLSIGSTVSTPRGTGTVISTIHPIDRGAMLYVVKLDKASKAPKPVDNRPVLDKPYTPLNRHGVYFRREIAPC